MSKTYWRVKCIEVIGGVTIEGWVRLVPAETKAEAKKKAVEHLKKKTPGSNPKAVMADQELHAGLGQTIRVVYLDEAKRPVDIKKLLGLG